MNHLLFQPVNTANTYYLVSLSSLFTYSYTLATVSGIIQNYQQASLQENAYALYIIKY